MIRAYSVAQIRDAEVRAMAALPAGALMDRAAFGLASAVADFLGGAYGRSVLVVAGSGDNGGDALLAGAHLARRGARVEAVLLSASPYATTFIAAGGRLVDAGDARRPDVVIDGVVGIGGRPGLRADAAAIFEQFAGVAVVAVDLPSGLDADSGAVSGSYVEADLTVTFGSTKLCHLVDPAATAAGVVHLVDIGLELPDPSLEALQLDDVRALLPWPGRDDHKYRRGVVSVRTGSAPYPGAAVLSVAGAAAGICGMVRYVGPATAAVVAAHPQVVTVGGRSQAWVVGCGSGPDARDALAAAMSTGEPVVVDAAALSFVRDAEGRFDDAELVLTPHAGELASLLHLEREQVETDQLGSVREAARRFEAVVVLKGRRTLIAAPDGRVRANVTGTPWLAVAGAGDVLAGVIGALIAAGLDPFDAASVGCWLHGAAATLASHGGPVSPQAVADALPDVIRSL